MKNTQPLYENAFNTGAMLFAVETSPFPVQVAQQTGSGLPNYNNSHINMSLHNTQVSFLNIFSFMNVLLIFLSFVFFSSFFF
jgi:hypothetical protein